MPIAIPIAMAASAGLSTATSVYQAKKAGKQNERVLAAQERDAQRAEQLEREQMAQKESARREAMDFDRQRWNDYTQAREPMRQFAGGLMGGLYKMAGAKGAAPSMAPAPSYRPPPSLSAMSGQGGMQPRTQQAFGGSQPSMASPDPMQSAMQMMSLYQQMRRPQAPVAGNA